MAVGVTGIDEVGRAAEALTSMRRTQSRERQVQAAGAAGAAALFAAGRVPVTPSGLGRLELSDVAGTGAPREDQADTGAHTRTFGFPPDAVPPPAPQPVGQRPGPGFTMPTTPAPGPAPAAVSRPAPPSGVELAERLGQTYGTVLALQASLRARIVECQRWADLLEHREGDDMAPPSLAREYAAEAQGLQWGVAAVERIILALDGEKRPTRLNLPDALPGVLPADLTSTGTPS